jgi:hypothetical protein
MNPQPARRAGLRVEQRVLDLKDLRPIAAATFWHSLEHLEDPLAVLCDAANLMKPGGIVVVAVPNFSSVQARAGGRHWLHLDVPRHLSHFSPTSLARTLRAAGFEPYMKWNQEIEYDVAGWSQTALSAAQPDQPPVFFNWASGRRTNPGTARLAVNAAVGTALSALSLPLVPALAAIGRGSTVIMAARLLGT